MSFKVYWAGTFLGSFETIEEAQTFIGIESLQMEFAEYTNEQLAAGWTIENEDDLSEGEQQEMADEKFDKKEED